MNTDTPRNGAAKHAFQQAGLHVPTTPVAIRDDKSAESPSPFSVIGDPEPDASPEKPFPPLAFPHETPSVRMRLSVADGVYHFVLGILVGVELARMYFAK